MNAIDLVMDLLPVCVDNLDCQEVATFLHFGTGAGDGMILQTPLDLPLKTLPYLLGWGH